MIFYVMTDITDHLTGFNTAGGEGGWEDIHPNLSSPPLHFKPNVFQHATTSHQKHPQRA